MNLVYGVDEQTIIELAPVLFSIVAARAMNLPEQDAAFWKKLAIDAESLGFPPPEMFRNFTDQEGFALDEKAARNHRRSEEHTSELQSLMRLSYAVFCLKKKDTSKTNR